MEALVEKIASGPESLFSEKQRQQVRKWILGKERWTPSFGQENAEIKLELV
jgi:hypothetical protein